MLDNPPAKALWVRLRVPVFLILVLMGLGLGLGPFRSGLDLHRIVDTLMHLGHWAEVFFVLGFILATMVGIPGTILTLAAGMQFGWGWGTVWSVLGATLGALAAFWLARYGLHDWVERRWGHLPLIRRLQEAVLRDPFWFVFLMRFAPISPFNVLNFGFGLTRIDWKPYTLGTLLGIIPGTMVYVGVGSGGTIWMHQGNGTPLALALVSFVGLSLLPLVWRRLPKKSPEG